MIQKTETQERNVLGGPLATCSLSPRTGFFRDGCCKTGPEDLGSHVVCTMVTSQFLEFSAARGNDLSTPRPGFAGLLPGDRWCLCASRSVSIHILRRRRIERVKLPGVPAHLKKKNSQHNNTNNSS